MDMKRQKRNLVIATAIFTGMILFLPYEASAGPVEAFYLTPGSSSDARFEGHHPTHYYRRLPAHYVTIHVGNLAYYYCEGRYYRHSHLGYRWVPAPAGAVVEVLPPGYRVIRAEPADYYYYEDTYYTHRPSGYTVVEPPKEVIKDTPNPPTVLQPEKTIVIHVPNANGSYMPVTLQQYGDEYVGPNGERYSGYPAIDQLKAMYAKASTAVNSPDESEPLIFDIPNANGSYTQVTLRKTDKGYTGPEGEVYPGKPTVSQLAKMYAKK